MAAGILKRREGSKLGLEQRLVNSARTGPRLIRSIFSRRSQSGCFLGLSRHRRLSEDKMRKWPLCGLVLVGLVQGCSQAQPAAIETVSFGRLASGWNDWAMITVVAHRGYACCNPENTLEAIEASIAAGAEAVEMDVHMTRDGVPVLMHDPSLDRTTDSRGPLRNYRVDQLASVNACPRQPRPCAVPTLVSALDLARGRAMVVLDLKDATNRDVVERVLADVEATGMKGHVAVVSGQIATLMWVRAMDHEIPVGLYPSSPVATATLSNTPNLIDLLKTMGTSELLLPVQEVETQGPLYEAAVLSGLPIAVWTAHNRDQVRRLLTIPGVTRVLSDVIP